MKLLSAVRALIEASMRPALNKFDFKAKAAKIIFKIQKKLRTGARFSVYEIFLWPLLVIAGFIYYTLNYIKWFLYFYNILKPFAPSLFIVSVGNIKIGGTGKSPLCVKISSALIKAGIEVSVINRGYSGTVKKLNLISDGKKLLKTIGECSDEAYMEALALIGGGSEALRLKNNADYIIGSQYYVVFGGNIINACRGARVLTSKQRVDSVDYLQNTNFKGICLLDDAFQYYRLKRHIDVVVLDYNDPFSNGLTFPAGMLRDRISRLKAADIIIISKCPPGLKTDDRKVKFIKSICVRGGFGGNFYKSQTALSGIYDLNRRMECDFSLLSARRVFAFSALGDNAGFFKLVSEKAAEKKFDLLCEGFLDHKDYSDEEQYAMVEKMKKSGAGVLLTTFKDAVKLKCRIFEKIEIYAAMMDLQIEKEPEFMNEIINSYLIYEKGRETVK